MPLIRNKTMSTKWIIKQKNSLFSVIAISCILLIFGCNEVVKKDENNIDLYVQQANAYLEQYQFKTAFNAAENAIKADPNNLAGYLILASIHQKLQHPQQSLEVLQSYPGIKDQDYYFSLLNTYQKMAKLISAEKIINEQF